MLIIFDCDGVLVDSEPLANLAFIESLEPHNIKLTLDEAMDRFKGRKMADCLKQIEITWNIKLPESFEIDFRNRMTHYFETQLKAIPGIEDAIKAIPYAKCVASNGPLNKMKRNLEITGLLPYFGENIYSAYTIQKWKPDPELFLHACKTMDSVPSRSVVIEDSHLGIEAAVRGGFRVLAFGLETQPQENVYNFSSMSELPTLIERVKIE